MAKHGAFWDDYAGDLDDPEYRHQFVLESARIDAIDALINKLDELREVEGLSKADLARAIDREPAAVRRLLTAQQVNPTVALVADVAAALGFRLTLEPLDDKARAEVTEPLRALVS
jgi:DNA-binding phage protein